MHHNEPIIFKYVLTKEVCDPVFVIVGCGCPIWGSMYISPKIMQVKMKEESKTLNCFFF